MQTTSSMTWAQRLKRVFAIEIEKCEKCGGKVKIIASIEDPDVIENILKHPGLDEDHRRGIDHHQGSFLAIQHNYSEA